MVSNRPFESPRYLLKQIVPDRMPKHIVDALEAVEIQAKNDDLICLDRGFQRLRQFSLKEISIRQVGERVVLSHVSDLLLGLSSLGNILVRINPTAAGQLAP